MRKIVTNFSISTNKFHGLFFENFKVGFTNFHIGNNNTITNYFQAMLENGYVSFLFGNRSQETDASASQFVIFWKQGHASSQNMPSCLSEITEHSEILFIFRRIKDNDFSHRRCKLFHNTRLIFVFGYNEGTLEIIKEHENIHKIGQIILNKCRNILKT